MAREKNWFEVSRQGLRELWAGKPKSVILRELIQNAWDEAEHAVTINLDHNGKIATIRVDDDSAEGFRDLRDAFTLFAPTYKRSEPEKRGRFNLGEKQVLALCDEATITTTTGTLIFDYRGRQRKPARSPRGSSITVKIKMTKAEFTEVEQSLTVYRPPERLRVEVNGYKHLSRRLPLKVICCRLLTEILNDGAMRRVARATTVEIVQPAGPARLYELGIPVAEIDCAYDLDVQQKIPLGPDRETVPQSYLAILYAHVLNATYDKIEPEKSSDHWVRTGAAQPIAEPEAVKAVVNQRWGEKVVVADPSDRLSIDDAVAAGYRVVYGSELSKEEWRNVREAEAIPSSSQLFGHGFAAAIPVKPNANMLRVADLAHKIAERCLRCKIIVDFVLFNGVAAQYGDRKLTFNVKVLGKDFFDPPLSARTLDLILHELGHEAGHHTERAYLDKITSMAGELVMAALAEPGFFDWEKRS